MKFSQYQAIFIFAAIVSVSPLEMKKIADGFDNIFLKGNITAKESQSALTDARESYQTLTDYNNETDPERKKILLTKLKVFTSQVVDDLVTADMSLRQLFGNINVYLKEVGNVRNETDTVIAAVPDILQLLEQKIVEYNSKPLQKRYNVKKILSVRGDSVDNVFRGHENVTPTAVGFFFLEAFATIFGLSWGIISMLLSDFQ